MDKSGNLSGHCRRCGKDIEADKTYCNQCAIEMAEEKIPDVEEIMPAPARPAWRKRKTLIQVIMLLVCLAVIAVQLPKVTGAFKRSQHIRQGSYETDRVTDQCIKNLWRISRILQDGDMPGGDLVCPASGKPYIISGSGREAVARCPNPERHGFSEISVSSNSPQPKVKP